MTSLRKLKCSCCYICLDSVSGNSRPFSRAEDDNVLKEINAAKSKILIMQNAKCKKKEKMPMQSFQQRKKSEDSNDLFSNVSNANSEPILRGSSYYFLLIQDNITELYFLKMKMTIVIKILVLKF